MPWQPHADRFETMQAVYFRDVPQTVRRVGEPVEEDDAAESLAVRLENKRSVPVPPEVAGVDRNSLPV